MTEAEMNAKVRVIKEILYDTRNKSFDEGYDSGVRNSFNDVEWKKRTLNSIYGSKSLGINEDESQCDWALIYEYARSMKNYLDDLDEVSLQECIERVEELAIGHGGNKLDQLMHDEEDRKDIDSCVKIIDGSDWLLERTLDIEKREKLHSIALEATKVLRKLVNTP